jgi:hypothetical protein
MMTTTTSGWKILLCKIFIRKLAAELGRVRRVVFMHDEADDCDGLFCRLLCSQFTRSKGVLLQAARVVV